ncbi:MAG: hypothetical protein IRZ04_00565 [Rhodospirillales bacterium]|nr:hypothetical protein [Rhodospirillales bacterium]
MNRLALALRLPPHVLARRAAGMVVRRLGARRQRRRDFAVPTYAAETPKSPIAPLLGRLPLETIRANRTWILSAAALWRRNWFDLLGSGWLHVRYGMTCPGIEGTAYEPGEPVIADRDGAWLEGRINDANLAESRRIWRLIDDPDYCPIDWQVDFRSGFIWGEKLWSNDIRVGAARWADVKVPWELARMQHLATLAWAYALARDGDRDAAPAEAYCRAFRNQILDFIATNPPRFGVNWMTAMDVAIRAANWVVAYDLFRVAGASFDEPFESVLKRSLLEHGRHILANLEKYPEGRGNHYLADIAGLLFIATALGERRWLEFGERELLAETRYQFGEDGGNFEASTCYHRLSAEMVAFATALRRIRDPDHLDRIAAMAEFTRWITKPNGRVPQIGDNDSGRFLKLHPLFKVMTAAEAKARYANLDHWSGLPDEAPYLDEDFLDHRPLVALIDAVLGRSPPGVWLDAAWVESLR